MKILISVLLLSSVYIASYLGMVWGWGLEPENLGWIVASYLWMAFVSMASAILTDD